MAARTRRVKWSEVGRYWGTAPEDRDRPYPCDGTLPAANEAYFRGIDVHASAATTFRWLCQLRVAPYSYDLIDNFGRRSPRTLTPGLEQLEVGQRFMSIFDLASFEKDVHITLRLRNPGVFPLLAVTYLVASNGDDECRLLVKLAVAYKKPAILSPVRVIGPWLDLIMMRRQLMTLKDLAER